MNDNVLIFLKKLYSSAFSDFENMYVVGSTSRRLLHVGVDASQPPMEPVNSILDIDIVAGPITARPDTVFLRDIAEKLLSLELPGTRPDKKTLGLTHCTN
ncbi:hypothetical protein WA1_27805 [Scytonema hofmannii PCC 7110]|uniref:Uncharacterized protein n=1 Tax=Scytonema hofmannii PCC 7110 TaxID=128403 RepID=A0A139X6L0_9CYAN|nr:hypothetical protein [Scytonema hofmannii]KYC40337.1 hypothetical protein WA1_27805 [Scytonema hofmannii PCC 7110]